LTGNGYNIARLDLISPPLAYQGLFGKLQNASISDLSLSEANIYGNSSIGMLCGESHASLIQDIQLSGSVNGNQYIGALTGYTNGGSILRCSADATIYSRNDYAGVLIGSNSGNCLVYLCSTTGSVRGHAKVGGILGENNYGTLSNSYSHATAAAYHYCGGAVGLAGWNNPGNISYTYSSGRVTQLPGGWDNGGFLGGLQNGSVTNSYWDKSTSGWTSSAGGAGVSGLLTEDMTFPYAPTAYIGWDFGSVWREDPGAAINRGYPFLHWQSVPVPAVPQNLLITAGNGDILLSWDPVVTDTEANPAIISYYLIYSCDTPQGEYQLLGQSIQPSFTDADVTINRRFYRIRAIIE
jgi:hypothetical protein